jgi:membrane protein YqaA with SNARE-associated domain
MGLQELLWFIFADQLVAAILIPINEAYILDSAVIMRSKNIMFFIYAMAGSIIGALINYGFGRFFVASFKISFAAKKQHLKFIYLALVLTIIDVYGPAVSFLCGICKLKFKNFVISITLIYIGYFTLKYYLFY